MTEHQPRQVDLSNCDEEPIHIPGGIQPHGCLLAFQTEDLTLAQWSFNAQRWLDRELEVGLPLASFFCENSVASLQRVIAGRADVVHPLRVGIGGGHETIFAAAHHHQDVLIVELEDVDISAELPVDDTLESLPLRLNLANQQLQSCPSLDSLYGAIAEQVREISGYDRVMVYRFLTGGHGAVVGEAVREDLESFYGLHYPSTDIPQQARRLYKLNTVRSIADINATPISIVPAANSRTGNPLDLSFSCYRAVSPIHIEYLRNMGVAASMSISILSEGELWGLIACHHYSPRILSFEQRAACEILGLMSGTYLTAREQSEQARLRMERQTQLTHVVRELSSARSFHEALQRTATDLLGVVDANGLVVCWRGSIQHYGQTPSDVVVTRVLEELSLNPDLDSWHSDSLGEAFAMGSSELGPSCGCLGIPLEGEKITALLFFRDEYADEVRWAGEPQKRESHADDGLVRLSPRLSFAAWKEVVRGRSREWSTTDIIMAEELRTTMVELLSRRAAELFRINEELVRLNEDLDSFAYAASHDLREPLRGLNHTVHLLQRELGESESDIIAKRCAALNRLTDRMDSLLDGLLRLSRAGRGDLEKEQFDLAQVTRDALEMAPELTDREDVEIAVPEHVPVYADYSCVRELLGNLIVNSVKYNEGKTKRVEVSRQLDDARATVEGRPLPVFTVKDNGIGIEPEQRDAVFQIFRRLHPPEAYGGGSGAGLSIAKKIVQRHGGEIWIESSPEAGTTIKFTLEPKAP